MTKQYRVTLYWDGRFGSAGPDFAPSCKIVQARSPLDAIRRAQGKDGDFRFLRDPVAARSGKRLKEGCAYLVEPHRALWVRAERLWASE